MILDLQEASDLEVFETFTTVFNVENRLAIHETWKMNEKLVLESRLEGVIDKLKAGGTTKEDCRSDESVRDRKVRFRKEKLKIEYDLNTDDPRTIAIEDIHEFLFKYNLASPTGSNPDLSRNKTAFKQKISQAVNNVKKFENSGMTPFRLDAEFARDTMRVKTLEDYTRDAMNDHGLRTQQTLSFKKKDIQNNIALMEVYGNVPADIKMMASIHVEHALEFSIKVAQLQDQMLKATLLSFNTGISSLPQLPDSGNVIHSGIGKEDNDH